MKLQQFINYPGLSTQKIKHQKFEQQKQIYNIHIPSKSKLFDWY